MRKNVQNGAIMFTLALVFALVMGGAASAAPVHNFHSIGVKHAYGFDGFNGVGPFYGNFYWDPGYYPWWNFRRHHRHHWWYDPCNCWRGSCGCNNFIR